MTRKPRLTMPLVRKDGRLQPAGWQEAIAAATAGMQAVKTEHGSSALGVFSCSKATNETNYLAQKFARTALETNNIDSCNRT